MGGYSRQLANCRQPAMTPIICQPLLLEACVESLEEAIAAERRGAGRIELCSALDQDGLTPSHELIAECRQCLSIPLMVMVRPRSGDFVYSAEEVAQMEVEIDFCKAQGVTGVVFGLLTADRRIDLANTERLIRTAQPLEVTFHKAIDSVGDLLQALGELNALDGLTRVLTSGGAATAWAGREMLKAMQAMPGRRVSIVAAGRLLPENRERLADHTGIAELHGRRIV